MLAPPVRRRRPAAREGRAKKGQRASAGRRCARMSTMDSFPKNSPLISVADLAAALAADRPPALLDIRFQLGRTSSVGDYEAGHLPGARFVDLDRELAAPPGAAGRHPLPDEETLGAALSRAGV